MIQIEQALLPPAFSFTGEVRVRVGVRVRVRVRVSVAPSGVQLHGRGDGRPSMPSNAGR